MRHATLYFAVFSVAAICLYGCKLASPSGDNNVTQPAIIASSATSDGNSGNTAGGWFTIQSAGGIGIAVVSVLSLAILAWLITKLYDRVKCRYHPPKCK